MTSLANLIYAQTLYKYAVDNSVKSVTVSPDIPQPIAEYMATQVPKHPLVKTDILSIMGGSSPLTAIQCQKWWRQMISSTKIAEKELALSSLAKLVDGFRHVLYNETVAGLKADEVKYNHLTKEMEREQKEKAEKARLEKEQQERERLAKERQEREQQAKQEAEASKEKEEASQASQPASKSDDEDVEMADAVEELKEDEDESKKEAQKDTTEADVESVKVKEEEKDAEVETQKKDAVVEEPDQEEKEKENEEEANGAEADVESEAQDVEESESEKETTADVETDRGETEEPDESELDRVTETPEAGATPGSEERTRKRARSTTEDSDSRKRSRRNTSAAPSANRKFQNVAGNLLSNISSNKSASFFTHPVNPNSAPNYYELIFSPTDIRTIKAQVKDGRISSTSELEREVAKMFANAIMYNPWDSDVNLWAREMQQETDALLTLFRGAGGE